MSEVEPKEKQLNLRQEKFCQLYATDAEFFGNGVQAYIEVYEPNQKETNWYKTACASASQILSNIKVCQRINELLQEQGLNNEFIDKQLLFLATQHSDYTNKLGAIREYNKLKERIVDKLKLSGEVKIIKNDKELDAIAKEVEKKLKAKKIKNETNSRTT